MNRQSVLAAFFACMSSGAWAQPSAPGTLPVRYPDPQCTRPNADRIDKPQTHYSAQGFDAGAVGSYNSRVKAFNKETVAYNSCMHAYIDKANADVKVIQDKANADLKQITERANASMKAIQVKIKQAVADANSVS